MWGEPAWGEPGGSKLPPKVHDPHPEWSILVRVWPSIRLKEVPQGPKGLVGPALLHRWRTTRQIFRPRYACGATNAITDVDGVTVGHSTLAAGNVQTGVTAIVPPGDTLYQHPLPCGVAVLNGFSA